MEEKTDRKNGVGRKRFEYIDQNVMNVGCVGYAMMKRLPQNRDAFKRDN